MSEDATEINQGGAGAPPYQVRWTAHPLVDAYPEYRRLTDEEFSEMAAAVGEDAALAYFKARERRIKDSQEDPFRHEFPLVHWEDLEKTVLNHTVTFVPGGNNPGKSRWAASFVMRVFLKRVTWDECAPDGRIKILMLAQDEGASRMFQQDKVYAQLPKQWRRLNEAAKKPPGFAKAINYSDKNGFTEATAVAPKPFKAQIWWRTVAQYTKEPQSFEGPDYDLAVIDEGCPPALFHTLRGRVAKRGGKIIYLLTCVNGFDLTMGLGILGARLVEQLDIRTCWRRGENGEPERYVNPDVAYPELKMTESQTQQLEKMGVKPGCMPYKMQPANLEWAVVFMWNIWNPFQPRGKWNPKMPAQMDSCVGDPKWRVLVKMFGWIERMGQLAIGNFNMELHVVRGSAREELDKMVREGKCTVYMADDPETARSHAILWQATFPPSKQYPRGLKYLFDECPRAREGEWVNAQGERGEGQFVYKSTGSNFYKRLIREREKEWNICDQLQQVEQCHPVVVRRSGDPRGFATEESTATGTRSLFELYQEDHSDEHPFCGSMIFSPARIRRSSSLDIDGLIDMFRFDEKKYREQGGFTAENAPARLVSERCENWIACASNYTLTDLGKADEDNPYRDFIDADRYNNAQDTPYIDVEASQVSGGGTMG